MPSLFVIKGRDQGKRFELSDDVVGIGRDKTNQIQIHDTEVSRRHVELRQGESGFELADLESSNGSFVNSERVEQHELHNGDRVQLGRTLMIYTSADESPSVDVADEVDIVGQAKSGESRIVESLSQEGGGSGLLQSDDQSQSPWLARARSNLDVMYHTALAASHTLDIDQLLQRIMELIFEWVEADRGCIMLVDQETAELSPAVRLNRQGVRSIDKMQISRTILDYVMNRKEGVVTSDAREDDRWDAAGSILKMGVREAICVPMQGRYGVVGVIYIDTYTPPGRSIQRAVNKFSQEHLKLMVAIGHQAALAIEDTSYYSAMVQAERLAAMGQTIATLSHHVKNILQGIRGGSYLIEEGLKGHEWDVVGKGWDIVEKNQERISNLVMDMLSFSKDRQPDIVSANLNEVAGEVVELMRQRAKDAQVELSWTPDPKMPVVTFDPESINRAVMNVVTNAIDACEGIDQGSVKVSTRYDAEAETVEVAVNDNGEGILPEDLSRIFSVFESRKGSRGTGLGLPVSKKIMLEHDGDILVASEPGQGACFVLCMPAVAPEPIDATLTGFDADAARE